MVSLMDLGTKATPLFFGVGWREKSQSGMAQVTLYMPLFLCLLLVAYSVDWKGWGHSTPLNHKLFKGSGLIPNRTMEIKCFPPPPSLYSLRPVCIICISLSFQLILLSLWVITAHFKKCYFVPLFSKDLLERHQRLPPLAQTLAVMQMRFGYQ